MEYNLASERSRLPPFRVSSSRECKHRHTHSPYIHMTWLWFDDFDMDYTFVNRKIVNALWWIWIIVRKTEKLVCVCMTKAEWVHMSTKTKWKCFNISTSTHMCGWGRNLCFFSIFVYFFFFLHLSRVCVCMCFLQLSHLGLLWIIYHVSAKTFSFSINVWHFIAFNFDWNFDF